MCRILNLFSKHNYATNVKSVKYMLDFCKSFDKDSSFGFEEITYLLLFDELPNKEKLAEFNELIENFKSLKERLKLQNIGEDFK